MDYFCGLPQAAVGRMQCGWSWSLRGSWKVMLLAVFFEPPGMGEVGTVRASMCK